MTIELYRYKLKCDIHHTIKSLDDNKIDLPKSFESEIFWHSIPINVGHMLYVEGVNFEIKAVQHVPIDAYVALQTERRLNDLEYDIELKRTKHVIETLADRINKRQIEDLEKIAKGVNNSMKKLSEKIDAENKEFSEKYSRK